MASYKEGRERTVLKKAELYEHGEKMIKMAQDGTTSSSKIKEESGTHGKKLMGVFTEEGSAKNLMISLGELHDVQIMNQDKGRMPIMSYLVRKAVPLDKISDVKMVRHQSGSPIRLHPTFNIRPITCPTKIARFCLDEFPKVQADANYQSPVLDKISVAKIRSKEYTQLVYTQRLCYFHAQSLGLNPLSLTLPVENIQTLETGIETVGEMGGVFKGTNSDMTKIAKKSLKPVATMIDNFRRGSAQDRQDALVNAYSGSSDGYQRFRNEALNFNYLRERAELRSEINMRELFETGAALDKTYFDSNDRKNPNFLSIVDSFNTIHDLYLNSKFR